MLILFANSNTWLPSRAQLGAMCELLAIHLSLLLTIQLSLIEIEEFVFLHDVACFKQSCVIG